MKKWYLIIALSLPLAVFSFEAAIARDQVRIGGDVVVEEGIVVKDAVAVGGSVTVNGKVRKSAVAIGGSVRLGPNAVIGKDVVSIGGVVDQMLGSKIHGDIVELNVPGISAIIPFFFKENSASWFWTFKIALLVGFLAFAVLLVAVMPKPFNLITNNVQQNLGKIINFDPLLSLNRLWIR